MARRLPASICTSSATHLGDAESPLQLIMGKTRHKNPCTAMRYVKPGAEAIAAVTEQPLRLADGNDDTGQVKVTVQPKVMPDAGCRMPDAEEFKRGLQLPQLDNPDITVEITLSVESVAVRP